MDDIKRVSRPVNRLVRRLVKIAIQLVVACVLIVATLLLASAFADRRFADLQSWQKAGPKGEFRASDVDAKYDFDDYLANEARLFKELDAYQIDRSQLDGRSEFLRFVKGGLSNPATYPHDWNRTTVLEPAQITSGVVLMHGLSDSPYSMRTLAELFQGEGAYAVCLRVPGHGTVPAGLLNVSWEDWIAATEVAVKHVRERIGPDKPIYLCGYSNGGALAMLYTLRALSNGDPQPSRVFLFSPAIAITPFARASNWHKLYSWMPYFEKSKWLSIEPEYDPYKYCSFTKNAGAQVWQLTQEVQRELTRATKDGRFEKLPPIMTFQSAVDATIIADDVVRWLYDRLPANGSELVVFDVNREALLDGFYRDANLSIERLLKVAPVKYAVTVLRNVDRESREMLARTRDAGLTEGGFRDEALQLQWPDEVYSLAHVAIPFPPDDPIYGDGAGRDGGGDAPDEVKHVRLGDLSLRGEKNVLVLSAADMLRLRHNPFHSYMLERIRTSLHR